MKAQILKATTFKALGICAILGSAYAASPVITEINAILVDYLKPDNDATHAARLVLKKVEVDAVRAQALDLGANYAASANGKSVTIEIPRVRYAYAAGKPTVDFEGNIKANLLKSYSMSEINTISKDMGTLTRELAKGILQSYGKAAHLKKKIIIEKDAQGNFTSATVALSLVMDLNALPSDMKPADVFFKDAKASIKLDLNGAKVSVHLSMNPEYNAFQADQSGLKENLELILKKDPNTLKDLANLIDALEGMAESLILDKNPA